MRRAEEIRTGVSWVGGFFLGCSFFFLRRGNGFVGILKANMRHSKNTVSTASCQAAKNKLRGGWARITSLVVPVKKSMIVPTVATQIKETVICACLSAHTQYRQCPGMHHTHTTTTKQTRRAAWPTPATETFGTPWRSCSSSLVIYVP